MITEEQIAAKILEACPSFAAVFEALDDDEKALNYMVAGDFAQHLLQLYKAGQRDEFPDVVNLIEAFHVDGDDFVQNYATIGILEGIQNAWGEDPALQRFAEQLLPVSLQYWNSLNRFWNHEIPSVGYDVE